MDLYGGISWPTVGFCRYQLLLSQFPYCKDLETVLLSKKDKFQSVERQKGLTASLINIHLDPFSSEGVICMFGDL